MDFYKENTIKNEKAYFRKKMKFEQKKYINNLLNYYRIKYPNHPSPYIYKIIYTKHLVGHSFILNLTSNYNNNFKERFKFEIDLIKNPNTTLILDNNLKFTTGYSFSSVLKYLFDETWIIISNKRILLIENANG